ncbi:HeH/LEM domain-containing protein [Listeria booriae]|uniref:Uncharacterized protein n=2 Tax=Listeria booriae TaxID=1552123 RepID=A0A7X0XC43_9LIST|nr:hypothetical protein [Listeria booriae]MBC1523736.1 hypothetical protein [Listeria booriae]MBC1892427.1 hypothetical protein [Listeria booriae]MBC1974556.1 hypothetical protein [Listeria booriae]MBC1983488.1 hypothetical protein [Listeria booriae]
MTVLELKAELDRLEIPYASSDRKARLIELLKGAD